MADEKVTVYNLTELKYASDEAIENYLESLGFVQSHRLGDVRLALGYGSMLVAGACFAWDRTLGFERTKHYSAAAVAVYVLLEAAMLLWSWVEKTTVYEGTAPSGEGISIATSVEKNEPLYRINIVVTDKATKRTKMVTAFERPFAAWFDGAGQFVAPPFQRMLASAVPAIAQADPKRGAAAEAKKQSSSSSPDPASYSPELLDYLAAEAAAAGPGPAAAAAGASTGAAGKKGTRRRKA